MSVSQILQIAYVCVAIISFIFNIIVMVYIKKHSNSSPTIKSALDSAKSALSGLFSALGINNASDVIEIYNRIKNASGGATDSAATDTEQGEKNG